MVAAVLGVSATACSASALRSAESTTDGTEEVSHANKGLIESDAAPNLGGKLVYGLQSESNGWNPGTNQWASSGLLVSHAIFDTLAAYDERSEIRPYLAQAFEHDADFIHWTIKLRPGVTFHNGKPVNASAVARDLNWLKKSPVVGQAFMNVASITVRDDLAIDVTTTERWVTFPALLATQVGVVGDPDWLESNDSKAPIGTGPFKLDKWEIGNRMVVQKNPDYWQTDASGRRYPYLDTVEFRIIFDTTSRGEALKAGDVDVIQTSSGQQIQEFQQLEAFQVFSDQKSETPERFVQLNTMAPPFDDVDARRALAYATDKDTYNDVIAGGLNELANGPFPTSSPWFVDSGYPQFDPEKAKELVQTVKARHGGTFSFVLSGVVDTTNQQQLQVLQQQWVSVGMDVQIDLQDPAKRIINVVTGNYQSALWLQFDTPNPAMEAVWWDPAGAVPPPAFSLNFARNKDDEIGRALTKARGATDPSTFKQAMETIQKRFAVDVPYIWLYHEHGAIIASNRVVNMTRYTLPDGATGLDLMQGSHPLYQVWLH